MSKFTINNPDIRNTMDELYLDSIILEDEDGRYFMDFLEKSAKKIFSLIIESTTLK